MMIRLNYFINVINLFLIFIYLIYINFDQVKKEFEYFLITLILINLLIKSHNWYYFSISKKQSWDIINIIFFNNNFTKFCVLIFSIVTPIYMIAQKDNLVINIFIEKLSFLLVFIFSLIGFYLEFYILQSRSNK